MSNIFLVQHPHITEKATDLNAAGKYVFVVERSASKNEVKKAVKEMYKVDAVSVNMIVHRGKPKRYRNIRRMTAGMKKAVVTLKKGQTIDIGR
jgi:large subunit ribosomal protein L23